MTDFNSPSPNRCLLILLDGLGDRSYEELNFQTPLQAAHTPNLDQLAKTGANGLFHATFLGEALPSENAHFVMFGYDLSDFPGRGVFEALGENVQLAADDTALLSHFVSLDIAEDTFILKDGKPELTANEIASFSGAIAEYTAQKIQIEFIPTGGIRGILKLQHQTSPAITDTDPFFEEQPLIEPLPLEGYESHQPTVATAAALKEYLVWCHQQLINHPLNDVRRRQNRSLINGLVTQRAGQLKPILPFGQKNGIRGLSISSGPMYRGLASYVGLDFLEGHNSDNPEIDLKQRLAMAETVWNEYDFIHIHSKWPDKAAHTKKPGFKKQVIEALDKAVGSSLVPFVQDPNTLIVITADHSTPSGGPLVHSGEPVPVIFHGTGMRRDQVSSYDEINAASGSLGLMRGKEFMLTLLNAINRAKLRGIMQTPHDCPVWTTDYQPFRRP
ncbi:phosphoglycerate mutase [bacterium]|nr:phosphoglycerate mutase [bacterium]